MTRVVVDCRQPHRLGCLQRLCIGSGSRMDAAGSSLDCVLEGWIWLGPATLAVNEPQRLLGLGISHVINITKDAPCVFPELFEYLQIAIADDPDEPIAAHLEEALQFVQDAINSGGRVYMHCQAGVSRSGAVAIFCVMRLWGTSLREAYDHVLARRPAVQPNIGFFAALIAAEGRVDPSYSLKDYCSDTLRADFADGIF